MKIKLFSEDFKDGFEVDWPVIPHAGEFVSFRFKGGTNSLPVGNVEYVCDADGKLTECKVDLTY
jgi:hypothetical protein